MIGSLPFRDFGGHIQGVLRLEEEELVLEWRSVMNWPFLMGWPFKKPDPQLVHITLSQLDSIDYSNRFYLFHATLRIRVRSLELLAQIPGSRGTEITLYCKKRFKHIAQEIANRATFQRLETVFPEGVTSTGIQT